TFPEGQEPNQVCEFPDPLLLTFGNDNPIFCYILIQNQTGDRSIWWETVWSCRKRRISPRNSSHKRSPKSGGSFVHKNGKTGIFLSVQTCMPGYARAFTISCEVFGHFENETLSVFTW